MKSYKKFYLKYILLSIILVLCVIPQTYSQIRQNNKFIRIKDHDLISPDNQKFLIRGTNLGNWLNPEGYMFLFSLASSYRLIDQGFKEMVGPDFTNQFWRDFQKNYITKEDIFYIKKTGMNSIRLPFHYKLFTNEDYMGYNDPKRGFYLIDNVVKWCREAGLYIILDMHDAPGGQTGANIDDSFGYPWLMESEESKNKMVEIWTSIAKRYANEPIILGYDLLNEPISNTFSEDNPAINDSLVPLYKRTISAIRKVDKNHIILLAGAQWNGNFKIFTDKSYGDKIMFTCHRYWCGTEQKNIQDFVDFRDKVNVPMYMGETGENDNEWIEKFRILMEQNNIGWHYWPYKKMVEKAGMMIISKPEQWDTIKTYMESDRAGFSKIIKNRPNQQLVRSILAQFIENLKYKNNIINHGYIEALGMKP